VLFVGLTGGIGSGKSEAAAACRRLGAAVLSTDEVVRELLKEDEVRDRLVERWGDGVLSDGRLDRDAIAEVVFERPEELAWLEGVLFPRVGLRVAAWRQSLERADDPPEVAVVEVPLLFEAGIEDAFDATVAVVAKEETRVRRAQERDHRGLAGRTARQLSQDEKARRADFVVRNDGTLEDLERSMREVIETLGRRTR
jgi:dephospho-CoA kinase